MSVRDLLTRKPAGVVSVKPAVSVAAASSRLIDEGVGGLPVVDEEGRLVGFLSEREVVALVDSKTSGIRDTPVSAAMRRPAPVCRADESLRTIMARMTRERLRHLVVMDDERIAGVISVGDIVKQRLEQLETEAGVLRDYVAAQRAKG